MFKNLINKEMILLISSQLCFGVLGAMLFYWVMLHRSEPIIATVNITALQESFIKKTVKQPLSKEEMKQRVTLFSDQLNKTILKIAKEKNLILMPREAIIAGNHPDVTKEVANIVKRGLKQ